MDELVLGARVLLALACVVGLIWVVARRAGWGSGARRPAGPEVRVVGRQALGRHAGVAVVAVGERRLLLGFGEQQVTMLTELDPEAEPAAVVETVPATVLAAEPAPATAPVTDEPVDLTDIERATAAVRASSAASASAAQAHGALNGSILAPSTWKQALSALQERTVRR
jgi:flagellar protein FliO/FliZ